jgi:hypothetical protein
VLQSHTKIIPTHDKSDAHAPPASTPQTHHPAHSCHHCPPFPSLLPRRFEFRGINTHRLLCAAPFHSFVDTLSSISAATAWRQASILHTTVSHHHHSSFRCRLQKLFLIRLVRFLSSLVPPPSSIRPILKSAPPVGTFTGQFYLYKDLFRSSTDGPQATCR